MNVGLRLVCLALAALIVAACGGAGDGRSAPPAANPLLQCQSESEELRFATLQEAKALTLADFRANPALAANASHHVVLHSASDQPVSMAPGRGHLRKVPLRAPGRRRYAAIPFTGHHTSFN